MKQTIIISILLTITSFASASEFRVNLDFKNFHFGKTIIENAEVVAQSQCITDLENSFGTFYPMADFVSYVDYCSNKSDLDLNGSSVCESIKLDTLNNSSDLIDSDYNCSFIDYYYNFGQPLMFVNGNFAGNGSNELNDKIWLEINGGSILAPTF